MEMLKVNKPILYLDMDGVVVDFPESIEDVHPSIRDNCRNWCLENDKHHSDFEGLFASLEPIEGSIHCIDQLMEHYHIILLSSAPWNNIQSWSHKREWVGEFLPQLGKKRLVLSHRKDLNRGSYLVDDRSRNGALEFGLYEGQEWINFGSEQYPNWGAVLDYLLNNIKK